VVASRVAAGGVDASAPEHLLVASSPQEYVEAIVRVLEDSGERARLSAAGRARVLASHAWDASMRRLDGIIERCMHEATRRSHSSMELQGITE
jgi:glycosyltransferase involved in cell wall biosynthesis